MAAKVTVMVGCHRSNVDTHWQKNYIKERIEYLFPGKKPEIETVDLYSGGGREGDIFEYDEKQEQPTNFAGMNQEEFDMIFLPDCGGAWYQDQTSGWKTGNGEESLVKLLRAPLSMLKPGGYLYFSKILRPRNELSGENLEMMQVFLDSSFPGKDLVLSEAPGFQLTEDYQVPYYQIHHTNTMGVGIRGYCF